MEATFKKPRQRKYIKQGSYSPEPDSETFTIEGIILEIGEEKTFPGNTLRQFTLKPLVGEPLKFNAHNGVAKKLGSLNRGSKVTVTYKTPACRDGRLKALFVE